MSWLTFCLEKVSAALPQWTGQSKLCCLWAWPCVVRVSFKKVFNNGCKVLLRHNLWFYTIATLSEMAWFPCFSLSQSSLCPGRYPNLHKKTDSDRKCTVTSEHWLSVTMRGHRQQALFAFGQFYVFWYISRGFQQILIIGSNMRSLSVFYNKKVRYTTKCMVDRAAEWP